jgi:hypothetical protein
MDLSAWFSYQLKASSEGFVWAIDQVPAERRTIIPPTRLGEWLMIRHVFHLYYYEDKIALPHMRHWLGEPLPAFDDLGEDSAWESEGSNKSLEQLIADFEGVRAEQIALLPRFDETLWNEVRPAIWGNRNMLWIVTKTYQHTAEHIHDVLRAALFWDSILARQQREQQEKSANEQATTTGDQ